MNKIRRAIFVCIAASAAVASAQTPSYPAKPIKMIVPFAPGGGSDTFARAIAQKLSESRGYTIVIENKPGAGGNLGAEAALREAADGYTLLVPESVTLAGGRRYCSAEMPSTRKI